MSTWSLINYLILKQKIKHTPYLKTHFYTILVCKYTKNKTLKIYNQPEKVVVQACFLLMVENELQNSVDASFLKRVHTCF